LKQNGSAQGERAQEYVNISIPFDAAMGHFDQIPAGRPNGFHLNPNRHWKGIHPSRRAVWPDMFAI
jgi:hypothetical protein